MPVKKTSKTCVTAGKIFFLIMKVTTDTLVY